MTLRPAEFIKALPATRPAQGATIVSAFDGIHELDASPPQALAAILQRSLFGVGLIPQFLRTADRSGRVADYRKNDRDWGWQGGCILDPYLGVQGRSPLALRAYFLRPSKRRPETRVYWTRGSRWPR